MNKKLDEIIELSRKAIRVNEDKVLDVEVVPLEKGAFVSIGGVLDSILILALSIKEEQGQSLADEKRDAVDRPERHSSSGHMNDSCLEHKAAFKESTGKDATA